MDPFEGIAGHEIPKRFFLNFLENPERMPHALLLQGERGIGKFTIAFKFSLALNCRVNSGLCGECTDCRQILSGTSPDVLVSSSHMEIKAEPMRRLVNEVVITPRSEKIRIVIIDDFERVNETAANIFLKTLEEPPAHLRFLLVTSNPKKLLSTIISRCIPVDFRPLGNDLCLQSLVKVFPDAPHDQLKTAARGGRLGLAVREIVAESKLAGNGEVDHDDSYTAIVSQLTRDLLGNEKPGFAYQLKRCISALMDSVENHWKGMESFPKGLDIEQMRSFVDGENVRCTPVNYLEEDEDRGRKLREYDKAKLIIGDLKKQMHSHLDESSGIGGRKPGKVLEYLNTLREIERDLAGHRNIELSLEKLLT